MQKLEEKLSRKRSYIFESTSKTKNNQIYKFAENYKSFLNTSKTEREAVNEIVRIAKAKGFKDITKVRKARAGDKLYYTHRGKVVALLVVGKKPFREGLNIVGSHIDSPRLDLKPNPLYEDKSTKLAMLRTHYYGGIKKYNWGNIPLAIHGIFVKTNGESIEVKIGENPEDPVFVIPDLLPHLYRRTQGTRKLTEAIKGEELKVVVGHMPVQDTGVKDMVKLWVLEYLNRKFGVVEEDFTSAEIELVPSGTSRDVGFDGAMVGGYGQDDRISAFTSLMAILDVTKPIRTASAIFFDKEEIGSTGATGADSFFLPNAIGSFMEAIDPDYRDSDLRLCLNNSYCISADVSAAINPNFKDVHEHQNAARVGQGVVFSKYTGSGGKYGASDANPEFIGKIRALLNKKKIAWQIAEIGKVDEGGGGTIAKFMARFGMEIVDCGPAIISMHTPFELASKADVYNAYEAYKAFYEIA
jgi:aspartyl aminopeptidase